MKLFDLHCDTITGLETVGLHLGNDAAAISLSKLENSGISAYAQCFAIFLDDKYRGKAAIEKWDRIYQWFLKQLELYPNKIEQVLTGADLEKITKKGKIAAILTTESGAAFAGQLERIQELREKGCLLTSLTWNGDTEIGGGVYTPKIGLTPFGKEAVAEMERVGMIIDVSHLCDKAVDDFLKIRQKPFLASHSNCRAICNAARNLTDEYIQEIVHCKGLIGINYLIYFLREGDPENAGISDVIRHVEHLLNLGAVNTIALGSDFDGAKVPAAFDSIDKMNTLYTACQKALGTEITEKLFYQNALKFFQKNF